jgi:HPt (histidine-containing phosphotransfer) domain-containing protein
MTAARRNIADEEILALTVKRFYELMPIKLQKLKEAYETAVAGVDISAYRIGVHSMKSGSATIGLIALSEMARALELLANDNDLTGIRELHEPFVNEWEQLYTKLDAAYKQQAPKAAASERPDGTVMLPELLEALRSYMKNTDIEAADDTIKLTEAYKYSESIQNMLNELKTAVLAFDEDAASELINKMTEELTK